MGEEAVEKIIEKFKIPCANPSITRHLIYISNHKLGEIEKKLCLNYNLSEESANYLVKHYGSRAEEVAVLGVNKLIKGHPFIEGEIKFAVRHEYAIRPIDIVARRIRMSLVDYNSSVKAISKVAEIMSKELGWSDQQKNDEIVRSLLEVIQFSPSL